MAKILVAGLINLETTLRVEGFPLAYEPVRYPFFGVGAAPSGVGLNIAVALRAQGDTPRLLSLVGADDAGALARAALAAADIAADDVLATLPATAQAVVLSEPGGRRAIFTDLKDIQDRGYPAERFAAAAAGCATAVIGNINFARPLLGLARARGMRIVTDVHALGDLDDAYNRDFLAAADVVCCSHERLPGPPAEVARAIQQRFGPSQVVVGMGAEGALLLDAGAISHAPAVAPRPVVSTVGAGDALLAAFVSATVAGMPAAPALRRAVAFAGWKIGAAGGAAGFPTPAELDALGPWAS